MRLAKGKKVRRLIRRGLPLRVWCVEDCRARAVLKLSGERLGRSKVVRIAADRSRRLRIRLDRDVRRNLLAAMRQAGIRRLKATAVIKIKTAEGNRRLRAEVALKR